MKIVSDSERIFFFVFVDDVNNAGLTVKQSFPEFLQKAKPKGKNNNPEVIPEAHCKPGKRSAKRVQDI